MGPETLITFVLASAMLSLAPGPDNLFVLMQSALYGFRAGVLVTLGLCTGLIFHTLMVAAGVAAIFQVNVLAFTLLKIAGALYLIYLAVQAWRAGNTASQQDQPRLGNLQLYRRGILMNISNPKVAIFFLAFLPQFASPESGNISLQIITLGAIFMLVALLVFSAIALLSGRLAECFRGSGRIQTILNRLAAAVFTGLALRLLLIKP